MANSKALEGYRLPSMKVTDMTTFSGLYFDELWGVKLTYHKGHVFRYFAIDAAEDAYFIKHRFSLHW